MATDGFDPMQHGPVGLRLIRGRDARTLQRELLSNRSWLRPWEATIPGGVASFDMRVSIRRLLQQHRDGAGYPFVMEYDGEIAGQLNIWGVARGSLGSATIGYWVSERFAGRGITPTAVAMATDAAFDQFGLEKVWAEVLADNEAALKAQGACGFRREGYLRAHALKDGTFRDVVLLAILAEEWRVRRAQVRKGLALSHLIAA